MTGTGACPSRPELQPLRSVPSTDFGPRLHDLDLSVLVITYQAGKLASTAVEAAARSSDR
jgi:hypothetical protein